MVTSELIQSSLISICSEMSEAMMRTAYSPIFSEGRDFSIALFDPRLEMVAQGTGCPSQLGALPLLVEWCLRSIAVETIDPGDVIIHNDAYHGGTHLPEFTVIRPLHVDGDLVGWAANIAHHVDIGGKSAGGFPGDATDVYMEGFRLPPVKLYRRGEPNEDIWRIYLSNTRTPRNGFGDLHAMYSSTLLAQRRVEELVARYGGATLLAGYEHIKEYSERRMRAEIRALPDGVFRASDVMEDDGVTDDGPFAINVAVVVDDDELIVDYRGSASQARGPINCPLGVTASGTYNGLLQLTDPTIPTNAGCFRPIRLLVPPGSVMNVDHPGALYGGNTETHNRIVDVIHAALVDAAPDRVAAASGSTCTNLTYGTYVTERREYLANYQWETCGWGARSFADGNDAVIAPCGNSRLQSIEVIETRFPWLVQSFGLRPDSGGAGCYRGGLGTVRVLQALTEMQINGLSDRFLIGPPGLSGGKPGATGGYWLRRAGESEWKSMPEAAGVRSPSKFSGVTVFPGDELMVCSPGGGGYGDVATRDPAAIARDLSSGRVTEAAARDDYGCDAVEAAV